MASESGLNGHTDSHEASTSKSQEEQAEKVSNGGDQSQDSQSSKGDEKTNTVPFSKLFAFADSTDIWLMIIGTIGAIGNGVCMPLMTILFGDLIDAFGQNASNARIVDVVSDVALRFVYLAIGAGIAAFLRM